MDATRRRSGLFYSSLDTLQTTSHLKSGDETCPGLSAAEIRYMDGLERLYGNATPLAEGLETDFRHGGWKPDRLKVHRAMIACGIPAPRLERFANCGAACHVEYSPELKRHRLRAFYCGDRFCWPCAKARSARVKEKLIALLGTDVGRFLTLTRVADDASLIDVIDDVNESFARLRRSKFWLSAVDGGASVMEIKRGRDSGRWHVHLHCIVVGRFINHRSLSEAWRVASKGSYIVDVRAIDPGAHAIGYVAAYAGKGFDASILKSEGDLLECLIALRGRRLLCCFGRWFNADLESEDRVDAGWRSVGRLTTVASGYIRGDGWAVGVLKSLGWHVENVNGNMQFWRIDAEKTE